MNSPLFRIVVQNGVHTLPRRPKTNFANLLLIKLKLVTDSASLHIPNLSRLRSGERTVGCKLDMAYGRAKLPFENWLGESALIQNRNRPVGKPPVVRVPPYGVGQDRYRVACIIRFVDALKLNLSKRVRSSASILPPADAPGCAAP